MPRKATHGLSGTRFYNIYMHIKRRCYNPKTEAFKHYGGRGIKVSDEWKESFINFKNDMYSSYLEHVMKHGEKNTTIERVESEGNYTKDNCVWATMKIQNNNHRDLTRYEYGGQMLTITEICDKEGKDSNRVYSRIWHGWSLEDALKLPITKNVDKWKKRKSHGRPKKDVIKIANNDI